MMDADNALSTRPYLIRALYEWCTDNGYTPFIAVQVDDSVRVPQEYVKDGEIVLNVSFDATSALQMGNEFIEFKGRFGGVARDILVPVHRVLAIYARENGQGMAFPVTAVNAVSSTPNVSTETKLGTLAPVARTEGETSDAPRPPNGGRPALTRVK
ncbi:MAG: ClpXP protease specificity-enhancing factor [Curvibacter sp.]|nr:MAG: ClpXP protease specificity-enhancing factor [Curvibacter sp.]